MKKNKNFSTLTILFSIMVFFIILISFEMYYTNLTKSLELQAEKELTSSTNTLVQRIDTKISNISTILENIAVTLTYNTTAVNDESFNTMIEHQSNTNDLGKLDVFVADTLESLLTDNSISKETKVFIRKLLDGKKVIGFSPAEDSTHKSSLVIVVPIIRKNNTIGILQCSYSSEEFKKLLELDSYNDIGYVNIMTDKGIPITSSPAFHGTDCITMLSNSSFFRNSSLDKFLKDLKEGKRGGLHYVYEKSENYSQYTPLSFNNWFLYNVVPSTYITDKTGDIRHIASVLTTTILISLIALIAFILILQGINTYRIKQNQNNLLLEQKRYKTVLAHSMGVIWEYDINSDTIIKSDKNIGMYTGLSTISNFKDTILSMEVISPDDLDIFNDFYKELRSGNKEILAIFRAKDISGEYRWFELSGITIYDNNDKPITVIGKSMNIDKQKNELDLLIIAAKKDPLTKLYNRIALSDTITSYIENETEPMLHAFFMIDIDNFKGINDTLGHVFGDAVLIELSSHLNKIANGKNLAARIGGDEFAVFFYNIPSLAYLEEKADEIINIFHRIYVGENNMRVSGSIGISLYPNHADNFNSLLEKADIALYHSKETGKDCYYIYDSSYKTIRTTDKTGTKEPVYEHREQSLIDSSLISNVVDILFDARQLEVSLNMSLSLIGTYYNLDHIAIFEYSDDNDYLLLSTEWASEDNYRTSKYGIKIPMALADEYAFYKNSPRLMYFCNDTNLLSNLSQNTKSMLTNFDIKSFFQCAIADNGNLRGYITADSINVKKDWTQNELDSLTLLSKIIGGHLIKLRSQERINKITYIDSLTNIYNMHKFISEATEILNSHPNEQYIMFYSDINKFKFINEKYGYSSGDKVLIELANILKNFITDGEILGRIGGDKFIGLCKFPSKEEFKKRIDPLLLKFNTIKKTNTDFYKLSVIIGLYPTVTDENVSFNIDRANIARKSIKERHKSTYVFFDESMKSTLIKQKNIEDVMEDALKNEEFTVFYQPKFNLSTNRICGAEALVRWIRKDQGIISPADFVPIFEEDGFIIDIDYFVLTQVCIQLRKLLDLGKEIIPVSVNFSRAHINTLNWASRLKAVVDKYNIPINYIEIEITESALVDNDAYLTSILYDIHNLGFKLSMDDFGSGLSSLNSLRKLPFDILKIDKDFFQHGSTTTRERIIIKTIVSMANELNMQIISEGVETKEQIEFLKEIHCDIAQGFYFSKPIPAKDFIDKYIS